MIKIFKNTVLTLVVAAFLSAVSGYAAVVDKVLASVNGEVVTQREFDRVYEPVKTSYEKHFKGAELETKLEEARKGLLEQLVISKIIISKARQSNLKVDKAKLKERIDKIKSFYGTEEAFNKTLEEKGTNYTEFETVISDEMLGQQLVEKEVASKISVTPAEIKDVYDKNKDKFIEPKQYKIRGIFVRKTGDKRTDAGLMNKTKDIQKQAKKGADFTKLVKEFSEGPFANKDGDMGYYMKGQLLPEIDAAVFVLKNGEISEVVETNVGYHIFKVEDIKDERPLDLNEVSDFIKDQIFKQKFQAEFINWINKQRENANISYK